MVDSRLLIGSCLVLSACLVLTAPCSSYAEMTDPPAQADVESSGGSAVVSIGTPAGSRTSFDLIGGVPPGSEAFTAGGLLGGRFFYYRWDYSPVRPTDLTAFNAYKGGGCAIEWGGSVISCSY